MTKKLFLCLVVCMLPLSGIGAQTLYKVNFFAEGQGDWTVKDVNLGGVGYVWNFSGSYGMAASAYKGGAAHAAESWLISPEIDLTSVLGAKLELYQAVNKGGSTNLKVMVSTDDGNNWQQLDFPMPYGTSWTFSTYGNNIDKYAGRKIRLAFVYESTTSNCPTWEIKTVEITDRPNPNAVAITEIDSIVYLCNNNDTASVIDIHPGIQGNITIPETISYDGKPYRVTAIKNDAFRGCSGLTSITIPNSVTSIGHRAFYGCSGLTSVTIGNGVKSIGDYAFYGCSGITSIIIPNGVTGIGEYAFRGCSGLTSVTIGSSVTRIGEYAFYGCSGLTSVTIGNGVKSIGDYAFYGCSGITSIIIPNGVTGIGEYAFRGCSGLTSVTIGSSVTRIGEYAFYGCSGLTSVTIGSSVTRIGRHAFHGCSGMTKTNYTGDIVGWCNIDFGSDDSNPISRSGNLYINDIELKDLVIPEGVDSIRDYAFYGCAGLTSVTLPSSVTYIGDNTFGGTGLTSITIPNSVTSIGESAFEYCAGLTSITIPNSVTSIGRSAFSGCTGLTSITIPESVTSIRYRAFFGCSGLTSITIPNSVTSIEEAAFLGCSGLTSVTIPNSVTSIGDGAFRGCSGLTSVTIGNGVKSIGYGAFYGCTGLTKTNYTGDIANWCNISFEYGDILGHTSNPISYSHNLYINGTEVKDLVIPDGITTIRDYAFYMCTGLMSITIPNSVTTIGVDAFYGVVNIIYNGTATGTPWGARSINGYAEGNLIYESDAKTRVLCCSLTATGEIIIPNSVTTISDKAFSGCTGLTSIIIPNSVTSIGNSAFYDCSGLTSVTIGNSVTRIGEYAFHGCSGMTKTNYAGDIAGWCNIDFGNGSSNPISCSHNLYINGIEVKDLVIPDGVTTIKNYAFDVYKGLTSVTIGNNVTSIGDGAFRGCSGLTSVTIPNNVTSIGECAFRSCTDLVSVTIGNSVTSIGLDAFKYCYNLISVTWNAKHGGDFYIDASNNKSTSPFYDIASQITSFTFGEEVKHIPANLCRDMSKLTSVTIPNSVTSIGNHAFSGCSALTSFTWNPDEEQEITHVSLSLDPNAVYFVDTKNWSDTHDIYVYAWTESPFVEDSGWPGVRADKATFTYNGYDVYYFTDYSGVYENCIFNNGNSGTENKTEDLTWTGGKAYFDGGWHRLYQGENITRTHIGDYAFSGCTALTSVTIPEKVKDMGVNPFDGCTSLTSVTWNAKHCNDYRESSSPFYSIASQITSFTFGNKVEYIPAYLCYGMTGLTSVAIPNSVMSIGEGAFSNCSKLSKLHLGAGMETIEANAFAGCLRLGNIHSYAALPPLAEESSFANYNARLYVPCEVLGDYQLAIVFGNFKYIDCISSDGVDVPTNTVTVTPSTNDATFTWPSNNNANAYTLVITKDGVVFCTLTFNANGQLTGIAFAPSKDRNNAHAPQAAQATTNGWQFTVTGLNEGCNYAYTLTVTDNSDKVLKSYEGTFTTTSSLPATKYVISVDCNAAQGTVIGGGTYDDGTIITLTATPLDGYIFSCWSDGNTDNPRNVTVTADAAYTALFEEEQTALDQVCADGTAVQKIIRNGQVLILCGGKLYTMTGQEVVNN